MEEITAASIPSYRLDSLTKKEPPKDAPPPEEKNRMKFILMFVGIGLTILLSYYVFSAKFPYGIFGKLNQNADATNTTTRVSSDSATLQENTNPAGLIGIKEGYLKLDPILYQLTKAKDFKVFAKSYELTIKDDKVRVEIELNATSFVLPTEFGTEEKQNDKILYALVYIDKLVALTEDPRIIAVRIPQN